jgi:hypothetical protein
MVQARLRLGQASARTEGLRGNRSNEGEDISNAMAKLGIEQVGLPLGVYGFCRLDDGVHKTHYRSVGVQDRAVAEREIGLLGRAVTLHDEGKILDEGRTAG